MIGLRSRHRSNPRPTRFVSGKAGGCRYGLEDIRWIRRLGGEKFPAASNTLLPNLKKGLFFAIGEGSRIFVTSFLHSSAQMCLYQTPGRRPPPITGRFVNTVTRGWVGAPRFHAAVVGFVDRCLSRTRVSPLRINIWLSFSQADLGPRSAQELVFSGFSKNLRLFSKICAHSERYRNLLAGIFEILTFFGKIAFPLSPVLSKERS